MRRRGRGRHVDGVPPQGIAWHSANDGKRWVAHTGPLVLVVAVAPSGWDATVTNHQAAVEVRETFRSRGGAQRWAESQVGRMGGAL